MYTLGVNAVYRDSAASLVRNDREIAAEKGRFTDIKRAKRPLPVSTYALCGRIGTRTLTLKPGAAGRGAPGQAQGFPNGE